MNPDFNNNQPQQPFQQPVTTPTEPQDNQPQSSGDIGGSGGDDKTKKLLIIIGALVGFFIIVAIIALLIGGGDDAPVEQTQENVTGEFYLEEPSAVDVESINNSISDDVSGLDTDADFPEDNLNDQNLGL